MLTWSSIVGLNDNSQRDGGIKIINHNLKSHFSYRLVEMEEPLAEPLLESPDKSVGEAEPSTSRAPESMELEPPQPR